MEVMDKVVQDGKVAVLVSPGYGAGWSTWNAGTVGEVLLYDPETVHWVLNGKPADSRPVLEPRFPGIYVCDLGLDDLEVFWVEQGTKFRIEEHDGYENLLTEEDYTWFVA